MIQHRILSPGDFRRMPWKNGAGLTTEIVTHPPRAALDDFEWRASLADVVRPGPFSHFAGVDRILVLLAGDGMRLEGPDAILELRARFEPCAFRGDDPIRCTLTGGAVRGFNLMLRRGRARGSIAVVQHAGLRIAAANRRLCYTVSGSCECLIAGHPPIALAPDHALLLDDPIPDALLVVNPLSAAAVALVASIDRIA